MLRQPISHASAIHIADVGDGVLVPPRPKVADPLPLQDLRQGAGERDARSPVSTIHIVEIADTRYALTTHVVKIDDARLKLARLNARSA